MWDQDENDSTPFPPWIPFGSHIDDGRIRSQVPLHLQRAGLPVGVLLGNRAGRMGVYGLVYYKELAHVSMEADKSPDRQLASWRLRRANDIIPIGTRRPEHQV